MPKHAAPKRSDVWMPYVVFFSFLIGEGALVNAIVWFNDHILGKPGFGIWLAMILFSLGGFGLALLEQSKIKKIGEVIDPFMRASRWFLRCRFVWVGFAISTLLFGPMFTGGAVKHNRMQSIKLLGFISAVLFAAVFVLLSGAIGHLIDPLI